MNEKSRKKFISQFKAKVAIRDIKTVTEIAREFGVHPAQAGHWTTIHRMRRRKYIVYS